MTPPETGSYRDELAAATARLAHLEERLLRERGPAPKPQRIVAGGRLAVLLLIALVSGVVGLFFGVVRQFRAAEHPRIEVLPPPSVPPPVPPRTNLGWYEPETTWSGHHGPWVADAAGTPVLVGMMFRRGADESGLHVAAFDRNTLQLRWTAGPFPSVLPGSGPERYHERDALVVQGTAVVLADSAGMIRVLDVATGALRSETKLRRGVRGVCLTTAGTIELGFGAHTFKNDIPSMFPWELDASQPYLFDPTTRRLTPTPHGEVCPTAPYCGHGLTNGCQQLGETDKPKVLPPSWEEREVWQYADRRVAVGRLRTDDGVGEPILIGWTGLGESDRWQVRLEGTQLPRDGSALTAAAMSDRAFYFGAMTRTGAYRVWAYETAHGKPLFAKEIARTGRASYVPFLAADGPDVFVPVDDDLVVIDAKTGLERGRLEAPMPVAR